MCRLLDVLLFVSLSGKDEGCDISSRRLIVSCETSSDNVCCSVWWSKQRLMFLVEQRESKCFTIFCVEQCRMKFGRVFWRCWKWDKKCQFLPKNSRKCPKISTLLGCCNAGKPTRSSKSVPRGTRIILKYYRILLKAESFNCFFINFYCFCEVF